MSAGDIIDYEFGISAIDSHYVRPHLDAIHLIREGGRAAIIDCGTNDSVPYVLAALEERGLAADAVDFLILTHVHLDHAGGAGLLMQHLPRARLLVHARGAPHMIDPARLVASTIAVYGEEAARRMYGDIVPVERARVTTVGEGDHVELAGRRLDFIDTPGHARHHVCIYDGRHRQLFTGDMFGLSYRELDRGDRTFVFPATTPTQFDPDAFHVSINRLMALGPEALYLTHYAQVLDARRLAPDLLRLVDSHAEIARAARGLEREARLAALEEGVRQLVVAESRQRGWALQGADAVEFLALDIRFNAQGLAAWLDTGR